eukprot:TRINITY_DN19696_c0_g1_i1.p1 TRINITY_DN19696_c0_g1~~TRINITY_DN19696_c0_g1_i1.p1  ORF type:complete len:209 (+),score=29.50 TRINITY_DN19696_c0_g1_i1:29-655(+)
MGSFWSSSATPHVHSSALFAAGCAGRWDEVKSSLTSEDPVPLTMIDMNCTPTGSVHHGCGLLHFAAEQGDVATARWLVEDRGFPVFTYIEGGPTPLMLAAQAGHLEMVQYFIEQAPVPNRSVHIEFVNSSSDWSAVQYAAAQGHLKVVKALVEQGGAKITRSQPYKFGYYSEEKAAAFERATIRPVVLEIAQKYGQTHVVEYLTALQQ